MKKALSFLAGLLFALLAVLASIAGPALSTERFEQAVLTTVNREAVGMSESDLAAFARETMAYLRGEQAAWSPVTPFAIPQSFADHMAEMRGWVDVLKIALPIGLVLAVGGMLIGRNRRWMLAGMLAVVGLIAALLLWAAIDFDSLWMVIHRVFIPGGIFPAGEPVMQLFPLSLFFGYVGPVVLRLVFYLAVLMAGICFLIRRQHSKR